MAVTWLGVFCGRFPGGARNREGTGRKAKECGYVGTVAGRGLWVHGMNTPTGPRRGAAERQAINAPLQGTAADVVKLAMVAVQDWLSTERLASRLILQVHDELVLEVPEAEVPLVSRELPRIMGEVHPLEVPLLAEVGVGVNWEQAH